MTLYLAVTPDRYELPVAVADSVGELARMLGVDPAYLHNTRSRQFRRERLGIVREGVRPARYRYVDVVVDYEIGDEERRPKQRRKRSSRDVRTG